MGKKQEQISNLKEISLTAIFTVSPVVRHWRQHVISFVNNHWLVNLAVNILELK